MLIGLEKVIEFGTKHPVKQAKLGLSKSATLPAKLCDEGLIGFKRVLVLGKI